MTVRAGIARLLVGTALVVPGALATGAAAQQAAVGEACQQLVVLVDQGLPEQLASAQADIIIVAEAGEVERCERVLVELQTAMEGGGGAEQVQSLQMVDTERAVIRLQDEVVIEGQVFVETQPPQVAVQEGQTEVMVSGGQPEVTVSEQPAEILIRQAPATVRLEMPQPTITIDQPAPEIIITMPPPGVSVTSARPMVEVRQAEPQVTVSQVAPNVEIQLRPAEDAQASPGIVVTDRAGQPVQPGQVQEMDAEVALTRSEPLVTYQDATQQEANVQIQRAEPQIRFEQSEPQVEVVAGGEPQIQFIQSGEAQVTFRESAEGEAEQPAAEQQAVAGQPTQPLAGQQPVAGATGTPLEGAEIETDPNAAPPAAGQPVAEQPAGQLAQTGQQPAAGATGTELESAEIETDPNAAQPAEGQPAAEGLLVAQPMVEREGYQAVAINEIEATELEGADVYGVNDEDVGEIGELILTQDGQVESAVIDIGGFLGIGERNVQVGFDQLTILRGEGNDLRVYIDATEESLEQLPEYEG